MLIFRFLFPALVMTACGSDSSSKENSQSKKSDNRNARSFYVQSEADLPACNSSAKALLAYVADTAEFKHCDGSTWLGIKQNKGVSFSSNRLIVGSETNICDKYSNEVCFFTGGQIVKFSDGTVFLLGSSVYALDPSSDAADNTDTNTTAVSLIIPPSVDASYERLEWGVSREGSESDENLYLVYQRSPEKVLVVFDTNGDGEPDASDEVVLEATLSDWPS
jgi:hypothetical protein